MKKWTNPLLSSLNAIETKEEGRAPGPGPGKCGGCGNRFPSSVEYEAHKTQLDGVEGNMGTECPSYPLNGQLDANWIPMSS